MTKLEALEHLYGRATSTSYWAKQGDDEKAYEILKKLIENYYKIGCELNNIPFLDDTCKLQTLEIIRGIYRDE